MHPLLSFHDENLRLQALTHRSYINEHPDAGEDNERLEFLGDAILTFLCGAYLFQRYPQVGEDKLTRMRASLVDKLQLSRFAMQVGLAPLMRLGESARSQGGRENDKLLSSTFEAIVGAYYLDNDMNLEALRSLVNDLFASVSEAEIEARSHLSPKNLLQEWVQSHVGAITPTYVSDRIGGSDSAPQFVARVYVAGKLYGESRGAFRNKKEAERDAALAAWERFNRDDPAS